MFQKAIIFLFLLTGLIGQPSAWSSDPSPTDPDPFVIEDYIASISYRTADLLCYAYTYYEEGQAPGLMMVNGPIAYNPFVQDGKYQMGVYEWLFIHRNTFQSAFWSSSEHEYFYFSLHSKYVKNLIEAQGFSKAIEACAIAKNLDFETLLEKITNTILYTDGKATVFGRFIQALALGKVAGFALKGFMRAFGFLGRITGLGKLGVTASTLALFQKEDSAYWQIWQSNQEAIRQAKSENETITNALEYISKIDEENAFWIRRWQHYDRLMTNVNNAKTAQAQTVLIDLYFIDYWLIQRRLDILRELRMESGETESLEEVKLNMVFEMLDFRRRQMERSLSGPTKTKKDIVAWHLLRMSEDDENFKCNFQDKGDSLCRLHLLYLTQSRNNLNTPEQRQQLQRIESQYSHIL